MKVILSMCLSANGIIVTETGSEDFLSHDNWIQFVKLTNKIGCLIWGRKTYEAVIQWEGNYLSDLSKVKKIVISGSNIGLLEGFEVAHSPEEALSKLEGLGFKEVVLSGGATLNSEFAKRKLIDEVFFDINPSVIGNGVPVFKADDFEIKLDLVGAERITNAIVELQYKVNKN